VGAGLGACSATSGEVSDDVIPGGGRWCPRADGAEAKDRIADARVLVPPIEPMLAKSVPILPEPVGRQDLRLEPKFDGFRVIAFRRPDEVVLQSRAGRRLTRYFPDIARVLHTALPGQPVVDGELVVWDPIRNRTDFALLQQRITAGHRLPQLVRDRPASFVIFDVLQDADGVELMSRPLRERRERLAALLVDVPPALTLCPQTTSTTEALEWMQTLTHAGIEGVVAKDAAGRYVPGRRGWLKYKTRLTTQAIIGGVTGRPQRPETLLLGRFDSAGRLRYTGRTGVVNERQAEELARALQSAPRGSDGRVAHPWPQPLPASWTGLFDRPQAVPYHHVQPTVVAEISVDTAFEHHRWRHTVRYESIRPELSVQDVPVLGDQ
jgi:ATP-dependent DNA ligase